MIRIFLIFIFVVVGLNAKNDIDSKINKTSSELDSYSKDTSELNKKMDETAKAILIQKKELEKQNEYLKKLKDELTEKESSYSDNLGELKALKESQGTLKSEQDTIEEDLVFVIAQSVSLSIILEEEYALSSESLIEFEVLKKMLDASKLRVKELNSRYFENSKDIDVLNKFTSSLEASISNIDKKRKELIKKQEENKKSLAKLEVAKNSYKDELKKLLKKQDSLKKTLSQLNIIKIDEANRAKVDASREEAFQDRGVRDTSLPNVKKVGSSYEEVQTAKYSGEKTIAPLDSYTISKKYGTYTDPIYGIKIFNESISLKPTQNDAKVKTVFNGKVIYADKTAVLDNVVIVEHSNGLHTIYANLSQISPNIKKGKKIKLGYTIGRVKDELIFEVTQKSAHINPSKLFE
ncbi:MAG: peptidoglycan DD-metalloendopeptidase family protein [Sulfurimonas sp.]|nr:peptidoglycan DD-metalloendopeptidase family protein [Sulfurimonas sp.]MBU3937956.1 peptidoglycan DD-metalloendopeptidase family protein [bacterium]MBU4023978.1 peptidoglycan DD-metalloendopeptidase family protein [bacterium]MBU4057907.1 peptidoglycan DD-metalloendopeptidase family protein [bacterium]MBU4109636.1 peptidoglycan DD-metalloendopeptidase family protein [bacterium]